MARRQNRASSWMLAVSLILGTGAVHAEESKAEKGAGERPAEASKPGKRKDDQRAASKKAEVTTTEERDEGVKTYTFSAVEVEGRLRSPQILYFLRRVRAEFRSGELGHRSFMLELLDTRRDKSLR